MFVGNSFIVIGCFLACIVWTLQIIVFMARHGQSQGENGNGNRFFMPQDSFTFRSCNKKGQFSNRAEYLLVQAMQGKTAQRS